MNRQDRSIFVGAAFRVVLMMSIFTVGSNGFAQGWTTERPNSSSVTKPSSVKKSSNPKVFAKHGKGSKTENSGQENTSTSSGSASTTSMKATRERRVSATSAKSRTSNARARRCDPNQDQRVDLSGTYHGKLNYPAAGLVGDATLTITGNQFSLNSGARTETGKITAVTTCNYTAVAMMFGEWKTPPQPGDPALSPLPMLSLAAQRKGQQLILKSSPGERREFSFQPSGRN